MLASLCPIISMLSTVTMNINNVFDCSTSQFVALFGVNEVKRPPVTFARSSFMNFIVFQLKLIKFKPKIKFIKFELHNYGLQAVINTDHDPCDPYSCSVHLQQFVCDSVTLVSFIHSFIHSQGRPQDISLGAKTDRSKADSGWGSWGGGSNPFPPSMGLGSAVSSRIGVIPPKGFRLFSACTRDGLS